MDQRVVMVDCGTSANCRAREAGTQTDYCHTDRQRNVLAVTRAGADALVQQFFYTPFGVELVGDASGNPFRYTGRRHDPETGLYYYRARYYDPDLGRFLQVDPVGYEDQWNLYAYVRNNPLNATDPTGECASVTASDGSTQDVGLCIDASVSDGDRSEIEATLSAMNETAGYDVVAEVDAAAITAFEAAGASPESAADAVVSLVMAEGRDQFVQSGDTVSDDRLGGTLYHSGDSYSFRGENTETGAAEYGEVNATEAMFHETRHAIRSLEGGLRSQRLQTYPASWSGLGESMNLSEASAIIQTNAAMRGNRMWHRTHHSGGRRQ